MVVTAVLSQAAQKELAKLRETEEKIRRAKEAQERRDREKQEKMARKKALVDITAGKAWSTSPPMRSVYCAHVCQINVSDLQDCMCTVYAYVRVDCQMTARRA